MVKGISKVIVEIRIYGIKNYLAFSLAAQTAAVMKQTLVPPKKSTRRGIGAKGKVVSDSTQMKFPIAKQDIKSSKLGSCKCSAYQQRIKWAN